MQAAARFFTAGFYSRRPICGTLDFIIAAGNQSWQSGLVGGLVHFIPPLILQGVVCAKKQPDGQQYIYAGSPDASTTTKNKLTAVDKEIRQVT